MVEEYAPRSAVYEALPDFLSSLQRWDAASQRLMIPESSLWVQLLASTGTQGFERSSTGLEYNSDSLGVQLGGTTQVNDNLDMGVALHHVAGSASVNAPTKGGSLHVEGLGVAVEALWSLERDWYANARFSITDYEVDLSSDEAGRLKSELEALGHTLGLEAGKRMQIRDALHWTPRTWLERSRITLDGFTDTVNSRVSFSDKNRLTGGIGVLLETPAISGSLDLEQRFGNTKHTTRISGEELGAKPAQRSLLLGLKSTWLRGALRYSAEFNVRNELGSGGEEYAGFIQVGMDY